MGWLGKSVAVLAVLALVCWLRLPAVEAGYALDDYAQLAMLAGEYPLERGWWDLFNFVDGSPGEVARLQGVGSLPWWSAPDLRLAALRPVASGLIAADTWLFGHNPIAAHLHSLLWLCTLLATYYYCLCKKIPGGGQLSRCAGLVGLGLFAVDESLALPLMWLANRNALVCAVFVLLAVGLYTQARASGRMQLYVGSSVALILALLAGEQAVAGVGCICIYELLHKRSWRPVVAPCVLTATYVAAHITLGYGARNTGSYLDPFGETAAFAAAAPGRFLSLFCEVVWGVPAVLSEGRSWVFASGFLAVLAMVAAVFVLPVAWRRTAAWLAGSTCVCILPALASPLSSRLLVLASLWWSCLLGLVLVRLWLAMRTSAPRKVLCVLATVAILAVHGGLAGFWSHVQSRGFAASAAGLRLAASQAPMPDGRPVLIVRTHDIASMLYTARARHEVGHPLAPAWWTLSAAPGPHMLRVTAPHAWELELPHGLLASPAARFFRRQADFAVGQEIVVGRGDLRVTVLQTGMHGPTKLGFVCKPEVCQQLAWLQIVAGTLRPMPQPPAHVGMPLPIPGALIGQVSQTRP